MMWPSLITISTLIILTILEINHYLKPKSPLRLEALDYTINRVQNNLQIELIVSIINSNPIMEVMIPAFNATPVILGMKKSSHIEIETLITPNHPDLEERKDDYWPAYIVKGGKSTTVKITLNSKSIQASQELPKNIWLEIDWVNYGPFGQLNRYNGILLSMEKDNVDNKNKFTKKTDFIDSSIYILPIKTHLLGVLDKPTNIASFYTKNIIKSGDILTIGETPLAIMQGRYINPKTLNPTPLAKTLCRFFHPTSSLATACGMQTLIDIVGPTRVVTAWIIGALLKIINIKGFFYRLAGSQARLIDDITGTTPPYDKTIVLGPINEKNICIEISKKIGIDVAIVDVNDLGKVKILASTNPRINPLIKKALISNPAGNANEQTPLVLVRPS